MTGFTPSVRSIIEARSGCRCEVQVVCKGKRATEKHHRRGRFMGGSKRPETNQPANGLDCCTDCHVYITTDHRAQSYEKGWLVRQSANPTSIPCFYRGEWVRLDDQGCVRPMEGITHA